MTEQTKKYMPLSRVVEMYEDLFTIQCELIAGLRERMKERVADLPPGVAEQYIDAWNITLDETTADLRELTNDAIERLKARSISAEEVSQ